jgi:GNAT superfamily N-acetyltransferase
MQLSIIIREVQPGDADAVSDLLFELGHPIGAEAVRANLNLIKTLSPLHATFVAVTPQHVVGVASAFASPVLHRPHFIGRLSVMVVAQSATGQGIGSALLGRVEAFLRSLGCSRIEVTSASHRLRTHEFYRRRGYVQQGVRFAREFGGEASV